MVGAPSGEGLIEIDGTEYYAIPGVDRIAPFLMNVVSDGDRWMFLSSTGALTAGRRDATGALFPYDPDDRLHDAAGNVGPVTAMYVHTDDGRTLWQPFRDHDPAPVSRCLYKSVVGDSVVFEERHSGLDLTFRYKWASSEELGFVRTATLANTGAHQARVDLVDGLVNLLPHGIDPYSYQRMSNLFNAHKRSEIVDNTTRLAVFTLESRLVDRPEPAEVLRASTVWSVGLPGASITLEASAVTDFVAGRPVVPKQLITGQRGAYLLNGSVALKPGEEVTWHLVADVGQDQAEVAERRLRLQSANDLSADIAESLAEATNTLVKIMARADASQQTGDEIATAHHFANVTYNTMRGGAPLTGYRIGTKDFAQFVSQRNRRVGKHHAEWFATLPETIGRRELVDEIAGRGDDQLVRLALEYLPFSFSRRHGDPSRPWNAFSIRVQDSAGDPIVYYEGNWRDIFQNWEALCLSFPEYLPSVVSVFVNASTPDGFNPYRVTRNGIDWEVPDPDDPWSNIGYWGDHQIVYLLRLLRAFERYGPGQLTEMLGRRWFSYADVPYRIKPYHELVQDPKETILFDGEAATRTAERVDHAGSDGKLLWEGAEVYQVTLAEKLLVPALAKLSNFVPGGGIWMNTQRPEWNDANNALVGYGLSMVTLFHLRDYLQFLLTLLRSSRLETVAMSTEVAHWLTAVGGALAATPPGGDGGGRDRDRKALVDQLGAAFSDYRLQVYRAGFSGVTAVALDEVAELCRVALAHLDDTISAGRRSDGLYHSYNLIRFADDGSAASVENLYEMLEGQVAAIGSDVLSAEEQADLVDSLFASAMYRADQNSFTLYPPQPPPPFLEKNVVPADALAGNPLLGALIAAEDHSLIVVDTDGRFRFNADFANRGDVEEALDRLAGQDGWSDLVAANRGSTLDIYEHVFRHHSFTGRSGTMYGYEGIGSIYWHMVAKLLVALQESAVAAAASGASSATIDRLTDAYWRVRSGLGFNKSAQQFGAIPIDPYSHTPGHAGAQQPGMTGLVKEEILTRPLETGVQVENGEIRFSSLFLRQDELLAQPRTWRFHDVDLAPQTVELGAGSLGITVCQVPIVVSTTSEDPFVEVHLADGTTHRHAGSQIDRHTSAGVFGRTGEVAIIRGFVAAEAVRPLAGR